MFAPYAEKKLISVDYCSTIASINLRHPRGVWAAETLAVPGKGGADGGPLQNDALNSQTGWARLPPLGVIAQEHSGLQQLTVESD